MLFNFQTILLSNILNMPLLYLYFVILLVHHYTVTAGTALPVVKVTMLSQTHDTHSKQMKIPSKLFPVNVAYMEQSSMEPLSNPVWKEKFEDSTRNENYQPCEISNRTFQHRERIPRADPCEMCVCVDSQMYCFWKLCSFFNLTTVTSSPSTTSETQETLKQSVGDNNVTLRSTNGNKIKVKKIETTDEKFSKMLKDQRKFNALKKLETTSTKTSDFDSVKTQNVPTTTTTTTTIKPSVCYVMGVKYKYGEILPRDTGTCLECACSEGGRVSCSPKDCVSQPDLDYLSHNNNLDMFELDTF